MKLNKPYDSFTHDNFERLELEFNKLSRYVMESKDFERKIFYAVLFIYVFIIAHVFGFIIGRAF